MRIIFHIDMNAFYANCEISQHPELKGKPIYGKREMSGSNSSRTTF